MQASAASRASSKTTAAWASSSPRHLATRSSSSSRSCSRFGSMSSLEQARLSERETIAPVGTPRDAVVVARDSLGVTREARNSTRAPLGVPMDSLGVAIASVGVAMASRETPRVAIGRSSTSVVPPRDSGRVARVSVGVTRDARAAARESVGVTYRLRRCTESGRRHCDGVRRYGERLHRRGERRSRRDLGVCRHSEGAPRRGSGVCRHTERPLSRYRERQSLNRGTPWSKLAGRSAFLGSLSVHRGRLREFVARNSRESLSREVERATLGTSREALCVHGKRLSVRLEIPSMCAGLLCEELGRPSKRVGRLLPWREVPSRERGCPVARRAGREPLRAERWSICGINKHDPVTISASMLVRSLAAQQLRSPWRTLRGATRRTRSRDRPPARQPRRHRVAPCRCSGVHSCVGSRRWPA